MAQDLTDAQWAFIDRISSTGTIDIRAEDAIPDCPMTHAAGGRLAECLQELGVPGAADLSSVRFYTNDFDTTTEGINLARILARLIRRRLIFVHRRLQTDY